MPRESRAGADPITDEAVHEGDEYEGAEALAPGRKVETPPLRGRFRELAESDEDA